MIKYFLILGVVVSVRSLSVSVSGVRGFSPFRPASIQQVNGQVIPIVKQSQDITPDGRYQWEYQTGNGIAAQEQGGPKQIGTELGTTAQGSFQYTSPEGIPIAVGYIADENGFQPQGAHLPTPPPIPEAILRSLEWNRAHPEEEREQFVRLPALRRIVIN